MNDSLLLPCDTANLFEQGEQDDMARRRLQKSGYLYKENGWWRLRWREDVIREDGQVKRSRPTAVIGRCEGPGALTFRKARHAAWDQVLSKVNQTEITPQSLMKVKDFIERRFLPEHVLALKDRWSGTLPRPVEASCRRIGREVAPGSETRARTADVPRPAAENIHGGER